jgi:hypothetical protein
MVGNESVILTEEEKRYIDNIVATAQQKMVEGYAAYDVVNWLRDKYRKDFPQKDIRNHKRPQKGEEV